MTRSFRLPALAITLASVTLAACSKGADGAGAPALDGLALSAGSINPDFDPAIHAYNAVVPFGTLNLTVTPTSHASKVTVSQDGQPAQAVASGTPSAALTVPAHGSISVLTIVATSGQATSTYTVQLVQADDADATLSGLVLTAGTLNPAFSSAVTSYKVTVPTGTTSFKVTPTATQADVKSITVSQDGGTATTLTSGKQSGSLTVPAAGASSTVVITITAQNGYDTQKYTLEITTSGSNDATLQSLAPSAGTLSPAFASATASYTLAVPPATAVVTLTPKANNAGAKAIVLSQDGGAPVTVASGAASPALAVPAVGTTSNVTILVTAQDGSSSMTYTVAITQSASSDALLSSLTISAGTLSPAFNSEVPGYTDSVTYGTATVTVRALSHAAVVHSITVSQDGGTPVVVANGAGSPALTVPAVGTTSTITVVVTAQDGTTTKTYTIALSQQSGANSALSGLAISQGTLAPAFDSATLGYTVSVPHGTTSVTVTPTAADALAHSITVAQDGGAAATVVSGHASGALSVPAVGATSVISVAVVSADQAHTSTYTITVSQLPSTVSSLSALTVSAGTLTPAFSGAVTSYTVSVPSATAAFTVTPTATDSTATMTIASGAASANLTIPAAGTPTVITVAVTAQSGAITPYTITVTREASNDASLSALVPGAGVLSPVFASGTIAYAWGVPFGVASATLTPTAHSSGVKSIKVAQDGGAPVTVASGAASPALAVPAPGGTSTITVVVTAEDNTTTATYTLTLTQAAPDTNDALSSLTTSLGALSPVFAVDTTSYTLSVPFGSSTFTVTPTAEASTIQGITIAQDAGAPVAIGSGTESSALTVPAFGGSSTIVIEVTAQSGAMRDYQIVVSQAGQNDSSLSALSDSSGALTGFAPATLTYSYSVPYQAGTYTITATTNDPQAALKVNAVDAVSGQPAAVALTPGLNVVTVSVTSADATSTTDYTLNITEGPAPTSVIGITANNAAVTSGGAAVDFGSALTVAHNDITFTIANSGNAALTITSADVTGGASDFSITAAPAASVAASDTTTFMVRFAPSAGGTRTGAITIANSSDNVPSFVINLTGSGITAVSGITVTSAGGATGILGANNTLQLSAAVTPAEAAQAVTWSSSAPNVASVDANGLVTGLGNGNVTITATATDGSGVTGTLLLAISTNTLAFVKQANGTASASISGGTITATSSYGTSGNAFTYSAPNYYGTNAAAFISLPVQVSGDFTITATVTLTATPKASSSCGIGVGLTTGFAPTDRYAYLVMNGKGTVRYVSGATQVTNSTNPTITAITLNTPLQVTFSRSGGFLNYGWAGNMVSAPVPVATFTDGTNAYGGASVYPSLAFNNITATVTNLVMKDGAGNVLFDSSTGAVQAYVPASLNLSSSTATVVKGQSVDVTATAIAPGGGPGSVTATAAAPSKVGVSVVNGASNSTITLNGLDVGTTTVTVVNTTDPSPQTNTKTIAVTVEEFNTSDSYGSLAGKLYPAAGETAAYADGELSLTFDSPPTLTTGGSIDIYKLSDGSLVDRIFYANETQTVAGVTMQVGSQLARVSGNTVYFTPHFGKLAYGTDYYVGISTTAISNGVLNNNTFVGFSNLNSVATWRFTTRPAPSLGTTVTVDGSQATGTADFHSVGGALMYLAAHPVAGATAVNVNVAAGTYTELVNYRAVTPDPSLTITLSGPAGNTRGDSAIIQYANGGKINSQNGRASFYFAGANLVLQNLTLVNTGSKANYAQAETLYFDSRADYKLAVNNSTFKSHQDTIQTSGRAWFYNSYIEGNTDFIWGTSDAALFENCDLHVVTDPGGTSASYSMFVARTGTTGAATVGKGYVLLNSRVSVDGGMVASYGRDAGTGSFYDQVALVGNTFSGAGTLVAGLWDVSTAPLKLGDASYVGWKAAGNTGLGAESATTAANTSATINSVASEYDTRAHILNRVIAVSSGTPTGYVDAATTWDVSALATAWGISP